jgi:hypothetical protein
MLAVVSGREFASDLMRMHGMAGRASCLPCHVTVTPSGPPLVGRVCTYRTALPLGPEKPDRTANVGSLVFWDNPVRQSAFPYSSESGMPMVRCAHRPMGTWPT